METTTTCHATSKGEIGAPSILLPLLPIEVSMETSASSPASIRWEASEPWPSSVFLSTRDGIDSPTRTIKTAEIADETVSDPKTCSRSFEGLPKPFCIPDSA